MLYRVLVLALAATAHCWNQCEGPQVDWMALDEGVGKSASYAVAAMSGNMYSAGYAKGNFAFVGVTDGADVNPVPSATLWGDTTSDAQSLYVAEVNSAGSMTKGWHFKGSAIQMGALGHGPQTNDIDGIGGLRAMVDGAHLAVKGGFKQLLTLPDGTMWSSAQMTNGDTRLASGQVPFVMKLDVSKTSGVGTGTTGWAKMMDDGYPGGVNVVSMDGDATGDMIVTYTGCATWDPDFDNGKDRYGRPSPPGKGLSCTDMVKKLAAADGAVVWTKAIPKMLRSCRATTDGSFFCGWSMAASDGTLDFGDSVTVVSEDGKAGIIKYNSAGVAQWAKAAATTSFGALEVSHDGTLLAYYGSPASGRGSQVTRIDTSIGNEGNVLWTDTDSGVGTHGFRDLAVTHDGSAVYAYGQITGGAGDVITDATGRSMTLRSRGTYDVFVARFDAATGAGQWAIDGGGSGMEYFLGGIAADPTTNDVFVAGYTRSELLRWGDVKRTNVMHEDLGGSNSPTGSNKALVTKIKSTTVLPSCLNSCTAGVGIGVQASDVKAGHCFIDRHCYAEGDASPYEDQGCKKCDPTTEAGKLAWSAPDTTSHCFIDDKCITDGTHEEVCTGSGYGRSCSPDPCSKCIPSVSGTAYSPITEGCMLDMATFTAACYDDKGVVTMNETAKVQLMADKNAMSATVATHANKIKDLETSNNQLETSNVRLEADLKNANVQLVADKNAMSATVATHANKIKDLETSNDQLETSNIQLEADLKNAKADNEMPTWAIAIIVVIGAVLLLVVVILAVVVSREQQGKPVFVPKKTVQVGGRPSDKI